MEALIVLFALFFFGSVIAIWYLIAKAAGAVISGVIDIADSALQSRQDRIASGSTLGSARTAAEEPGTGRQVNGPDIDDLRRRFNS